MSVSRELKERIRQRFGYCCAYCGVHEHDVGSELEAEHFHPRSKGGSDDLENLIYCCSACNRFKANYWPSADAPLYLQLLHPLNDDLQGHITLLNDGHLTGLTKRGRFHIELLHLNRPQLVESRLKRLQQQYIQKQMKIAERTILHNQVRIKELEMEVLRLQVEITLSRRSASE